MTWTNFYLVCFLVGFCLSLLSLLMSSLHVTAHLPGAHGADGFHVHVGDAGHGAVHAGGHVMHGGAEGAAESAVSPINFATIAAFLAWFGGSGYLLTAYSSFWSMFGLAIAVVFGLAGGGVVFWFLAKLASADENLNALDYEMVGVLGRVTSGIREGGTGEIVFSQEGTRRTCGARSEDGTAVPKGTEVVVTRYDKGLAYVRRWDELSGDKDLEPRT